MLAPSTSCRRPLEAAILKLNITWPICWRRDAGRHRTLSKRSTFGGGLQRAGTSHRSRNCPGAVSAPDEVNDGCMREALTSRALMKKALAENGRYFRESFDSGRHHLLTRHIVGDGLW